MHLPDLTTWQLILVILDYVIKIIAVGWVPENRRPSSSSAWLLLILLLPLIGLPLFLLMGSPYINSRRHRIQAEAVTMIDNLQQGAPDRPEDPLLDHDVDTIVHLNRHLTGFPAVYSDNCGLYADYEQAIERLVEAVDEAQHYIYIEVYIQALDKTTEAFYEALERAVARGVTVKLLFDQIGSLKYPRRLELGRYLTSIGVQWHVMMPLRPWIGRFRRPDLRNHRKIVVIDGRIGFLGSINIIDRSYLVRKHTRHHRQWVDVLAEFTGPIVSSFEAVFAVDWYMESEESLSIAPLPSAESAGVRTNIVQMIPSGPGYSSEPNLRMFNSIIHHATDHLVICSPYFIPDESMLEAVTSACYRGVDVELLVSEEADQFGVHHAQSSYYQALLEAGVRIYEFPCPYVLHTKFVIADPLGTGTGSPIAAFGSSNLDMRSFGLNYESTLAVYSGNLIGQLYELGLVYKSVSRELTLERWVGRPLLRRYVDNVMRLTSALQ